MQEKIWSGMSQCRAYTDEDLEILLLTGDVLPDRQSLIDPLLFDADFGETGVPTEELMELYEEEFGRHDWDVMFEHEDAKVLSGEFIVYVFYNDDEPVIAFCEYN